MAKRNEAKFIASLQEAFPDTEDFKLFRVETSTLNGVPDLSFFCRTNSQSGIGAVGFSGWIEVKAVSCWPKRPLTNFKIDHVTAQQIDFGVQSWKRGCRAWFLIRVGTGIMLIHPQRMKILNEGAPRAQWEGLSNFIWESFGELRKTKPAFFIALNGFGE